MSKSKEGLVEKHLCDLVHQHGGRAEKLAFVGKRGAPDRYCFFPGGNLYPVECKAESGRLHPLQQRELDRLTKEGFECFVIYSKADAEAAVLAMLNDMRAQSGETFLAELS